MKPIVLDLHDLESGARIRWTAGEAQALIFRRTSVHAMPVQLDDVWPELALKAAADAADPEHNECFALIARWLERKLLEAGGKT